MEFWRIPDMDFEKPELPSLRTGVAVHLVKLGDYARRQTQDAAALPDADRRRACKMQSPARRAEFLATRHVLRHLLASCLDCHLADVPIVEGADGKPRLAGGEMQFSVSHSAGWCAIALAADCPVGVDVEPIRRFSGMGGIADHFFPKPAWADYAAAAPAEKTAVFFRWWTRIEAAVKAVGCGLDAAGSCLEQVSYRSCRKVRGLALAVAARNDGPLTVDWRLPALNSGARGRRCR
jgi:4'-phosphopantetheinyl transferase